MRRSFYEFQQEGEVSLMRSCRLFGVSRQGVYQHRNRCQQRKQALAGVEAMVSEQRRLMPRLGARKLYHQLKPELVRRGIKLGRDGLFTYLRTKGLLVKPVKNYTKTTFSHHRFKKHPNLYQGQRLTRASEVVVSDITYLESEEGVHYLSLVTDAYSRKIVGHHLSKDMKAESVVKALKKAKKHRVGRKELIHHSDRGSQYCSDVYQSELAKQGIRASTTDGYDCYQNALAERVNGILKQEFLLYKCKTFDDLKKLTNESIKIYNQYRPHLSLGMKTPNQVHKKTSCETQLAF